MIVDKTLTNHKRKQKKGIIGKGWSELKNIWIFKKPVAPATKTENLQCNLLDVRVERLFQTKKFQSILVYVLF